MLEVGIVGAGLEEDDGLVGLLGEARGHDTAGGTAANHDVVILHDGGTLLDGFAEILAWGGWGD